MYNLPLDDADALESVGALFREISDVSQISMKSSSTYATIGFVRSDRIGASMDSLFISILQIYESLKHYIQDTIAKASFLNIYLPTELKPGKAALAVEENAIHHCNIYINITHDTLPSQKIHGNLLLAKVVDIIFQVGGYDR